MLYMVSLQSSKTYLLLCTYHLMIQLKTVWNGMGWGAMKWSGIKLLFHCLDIFMMNWEKSGSVPYHSNWKGGKRRGVLGTEWNAFHQIPFHSILSYPIQTIKPNQIRVFALGFMNNTISYISYHVNIIFSLYSLRCGGPNQIRLLLLCCVCTSFW